MSPLKYGFAIDRGGTFTDVYVHRSDGTSRIMKLLSEDRNNYQDAPTEAIRRVLEEETGVILPRETPIPTDRISWVRMGTTVATNALLERNGARIVLLITKGFKDLLFIGNQSRPQIFEFDIRLPELLYEEVIEIDERLILVNKHCQSDFEAFRVMASNGEEIIIEKKPDEKIITDQLEKIYRRGIKSVAVVLLHSYIYPNHEKLIAEIARNIGFENISLSSEVMPMLKIVPRGFTTCVDAYLTPVIHAYITSFKAGFVNNLEGISVQFMQSDGGLSAVENFCGSRAILSGPAGGIVGMALTAYDNVLKKPVIGFDMGGTSTDVSRFAGKFTHVMETTTAGITIQAPQLDIHTVAAGGGSRLYFRDGLLVVGPDSAGANPGPVCYRKGGSLSITDANVILGRILPEYFPCIFGSNENQSLDREAAFEAMMQILKEVNDFYDNASETKHQSMTIEDLALGFIDVANETMCRAIKSVTQAKGYDTSQHVLACFGGAGGQHACSIAKALGIKTIFIHRFSGILSAYGLALADTVYEAQEPLGIQLTQENFDSYVKERLTLLKNKTANELAKLGFIAKHTRFEYFLHLRYAKTDCSLICPSITNGIGLLQDYIDAFNNAYNLEFGFVIPGREIIVDDVRVRAIGSNSIIENINVSSECNKKLPVKTTCQIRFKEKKMNTAVYDMRDLFFGHSVTGPAIIIDAATTIVVEPECRAVITKRGDIEIFVGDQTRLPIGRNMDPIQLSIFNHRFMSIAEQMGHILRRTSISTNIKERLDFSCALFGPTGDLVANAPHIPVHLGGMEAAVRYQIDHLGYEGFSDGDVILSNHPCAGGSHLPDLTVITPVYYKNFKTPVFFVANRGHHADIGGLEPGSMPPHSTCLQQEGAIFVSFKVVENGIFQENALVEKLTAPRNFPGCTGARNVSDNLSDLKAQIAANQKGINLVCELIDHYGLDVVHAYMDHVQSNAEAAVRKLLMEVAKKIKKEEIAHLQAIDFMDDGTPIALSIKIDCGTGDAIFDFDGTGPEVYSNWNTPISVTMASIIYCLRCLVDSEIPLNHGCLSPIQVKIPNGTILCPDKSAAVVGGNVLTSQRICDVIFLAFNAVAASQGCMNNITFGNDIIGGYYETVAGGAGAGPSFNGRSAVHTHMTNTRITDPELFELRYPVILREFSIRQNSGGKGRYKGGDGCKRFIQFRCSLRLSILTERRVFAPYGLDGGCPGQRGLNLLRLKNGRLINLGGKNSIDVHSGDIFELHTPGGGGYGKFQ